MSLHDKSEVVAEDRCLASRGFRYELSGDHPTTVFTSRQTLIDRLSLRIFETSPSFGYCSTS